MMYIPFWVLLEYINPSSQEPFVKCKVLKEYTSNRVDTGEPIAVCDIQLESQIIVECIPCTYLINESNLRKWATDIGNWFRDYPDKHNV